jgi:hypothetical protein
MSLSISWNFGEVASIFASGCSPHQSLREGCRRSSLRLGAQCEVQRAGNPSLPLRPSHHWGVPPVRLAFVQHR